MFGNDTAAAIGNRMTDQTEQASTVATDPVAPHDWGPFGRPLFEDPGARALARVGVVDIGSNSVRLVVFDGAARSPAYFYSESGTLNPSGRKRALAALIRFKHLADGMNLPELTLVATAAVRDASDGAEFCADVLRETGLRIWVIDGREEARLSAQGVLLGWPGAYGLVCDIGGDAARPSVSGRRVVAGDCAH